MKYTNPFHRISFKLRALLLATALLPVLIYWGLTRNAVDRATRSGVDVIKSQSQIASQAVNTLIEQGMTDVEVYSMMVEPRIALYFDRYSGAQRLFNTIVDMNRAYRIVALYNGEGSVVTTSTFGSDSEQFEPLDLSFLELTADLLVKLKEQDKPILHIAGGEGDKFSHLEIISPIRGEYSEYMGAIGLLISTSHLSHLLNDFLGVLEYPSQYSFIRDLSTSKVFAVSAEYSGQLSKSDEIKYCNGFKHQNLDLETCIAVARDDVYAASRYQMIRLVAVVMLTIAAVIGLAIYMSGFFIKPVRCLIDITSAYVQGAGGGVPLVNESDDEFGILRDHFGKLIHALDEPVAQTA